MPFTEGTTLVGWGVLRMASWHFVGLYKTETEALEKASKMGAEYIAKYGEQQEGTDNFIYSEK